jgi:hypothetical protein
MPGVHQRLQQTIPSANKFASGLAPDPRRLAGVVINLLRSDGQAMQLLLDHITSFIFSSIFGVAVTVLAFYLTSHPTTAGATRKRLKATILKRLQAELRRAESVEPEITNFLTHEFDIHPLKSIVMFGLWEPKRDTEWFRWIALFEPQEPGLLDKLVGRPGFYDLRSFLHMAVPTPESLAPSKTEIMDFDGDGVPEVHITLKSTWADSISIGPLILKRSEGGNWQAVALPSISSLTSDVLQGKSSYPKNIVPPGQPIPFFGMKDDSGEVTRPPLHDLKNFGVYEDDWVLTHNGQNVRFVTLCCREFPRFK